jgi:hypothetical protein
MLSNFALSGVCTNVAPAASLIARNPSVPSVPIPDRITPILRSP